MLWPRISPLHIEDHIKANWCVWRCEVEYEDGTIKMGYVQGDSSADMHNEVYAPSLELDED